MAKGIDFKLPVYEEMQPVWEKIDRIAGNKGVRDYITRLNPHDSSRYMQERNKNFKDRAVFVAVTAYTVRGFIGLVFDTAPKIELPPGLEYLETNADGNGTDLEQHAKQTVKECIKNGRGAIWIDYPRTEGAETSAADLVSGGIFATMQIFTAREIFYWSTRQSGAEVILDEVRIMTSKQEKDGFALSTIPLILQLYLDEAGNYTIQRWVQESEKSKTWVMDGPSTMGLGGDGSALKRIPLVWFGSENNTWRVDEPPMQDICELNVAHLNNSAIHEDSVLNTGQPQPWMSGLARDQIEELEEGDFYIGSGKMIMVPSGEQFGIVQALPNSLSFEAMGQKIDMMIALGAMFIQPTQVIKTATQSEGEQRVRHSSLSLLAGNVSDAYRAALEWVGVFMNVELPDEDVFTINTNYVQPDADYNMLREMVAGFMQGAIPGADYHTFMKKNRLTDDDKPLEDWMAEMGTTGPLDLGIEEDG